jgi:hypothetical protein
MFSLIITIISIALVAALALATLYYGGSAFNKGAAGAVAARLINEGQQVNGAVALYKADIGAGSTAAVVTDLAGLVTEGYLSSVPADFAGTTTLASGQVTADVTTEVAAEVTKRAGSATVFGVIAATPGNDGVDGIPGTADDVAATPAMFYFSI